MDKLSKQLKNRNRLARRLLAAELRLVNYYKESAKEAEYCQRVLTAKDAAMQYAENCSPAHVQFLKMFMAGHNETAICETVHIQPSTYYAWQRDIVRVFANHMGIPV